MASKSALLAGMKHGITRPAQGFLSGSLKGFGIIDLAEGWHWIAGWVGSQFGFEPFQGANGDAATVTDDAGIEVAAGLVQAEALLVVHDGIDGDLQGAGYVFAGPKAVAGVAHSSVEPDDMFPHSQWSARRR